MGVKKQLLNKTLFLDTAPLIYFIEGHSRYQDKLLEIFKANDSGKIFVQTSTLTLIEVLVQPIRMNKKELAKQYEEVLTASPNIDIYEVDLPVSKRAAMLRAEHNLKTPDAIQIDTGIEKKADFFLTNDYELKKITAIEVLVIEDL